MTGSPVSVETLHTKAERASVESESPQQEQSWFSSRRDVEPPKISTPIYDGLLVERPSIRSFLAEPKYQPVEGWPYRAAKTAVHYDEKEQ